MRIRTAIFGVYVGASAIGFVILMAVVLRETRLRYTEAMRRTLGDTAVFLAAFAAEGDTTRENWPQRFRALPEQAQLLRVFASDPEGRVVFDSAARDVGRVYDWPMRGGGPYASEHYTVSNVAQVDGELRVRAAVRRHGELWGWVGVGRPLATLAEGITRARTQLLWYALSIAAAMVAAGWWIASRLTQSIERLTAYAQAVRDGRSEPPPDSRAAEVAELTRAFEEMRRTLEGKAYVERYTQALAHEFKAPLSAMRGAAELLGEDMPREDQARFLANLRAETERLQRIVDRMLELSTLEARTPGAGFREVELGTVLTDVVAQAIRAAELRRVRVTCERTGEARLRGDGFWLGQAVGNLVQNAVEFSPEGGEVTVRMEPGADAVTITIDDQGPGVPAYARERVFERFYSLPRPQTGRKSSGLGLSIVREVVRLHGGDVQLDNRPAGGARATLRLPLRRASGES